MRILVTGATGYVGKALVPKLKELYGDITTLSSKNYFYLKGKFDWDKLDGEGNELCKNLFTIQKPKFDIIIHLAVKTHAGDYCQKHPGEQFLINSNINNTILQYWKLCQPQAHFITFGSSCGYNNDVVKKPENYLIGEPEKGYEVYGYIKRHLLIGLQALHKEYNMSFDYLIPSTIYGPGYDLNDKHFIFDLIKKLTNFNEIPILWGNGQQKRDLIYIDDVINTIINKIQKWSLSNIENKVSFNNIENLCSGQNLTIEEYANIICKIIKRDPKIIKWDISKHTGTLDKSLIRGFDMPLNYSYYEGLKNTISYYSQFLK